MTRVAALAAMLVLTGIAASGQAGSPTDWRLMSGTWSAVGQRETLPTEGDREAAVVHLSGTVVLATGDGLSRGFRAEVIAFDDGTSVSAGRAVWTDSHGDRIFSVLKGETVASGRRIEGTIAGGTGRYRGVTGQFSFTWQYVLGVDVSGIQGRVSDLEGRFRFGEAQR